MRCDVVGGTLPTAVRTAIKPPRVDQYLRQAAGEVGVVIVAHRAAENRPAGPGGSTPRKRKSTLRLGLGRTPHDRGNHGRGRTMRLDLRRPVRHRFAARPPRCARRTGGSARDVSFPAFDRQDQHTSTGRQPPETGAPGPRRCLRRSPELDPGARSGRTTAANTGLVQQRWRPPFRIGNHNAC